MKKLKQALIIILTFSLIGLILTLIFDGVLIKDNKYSYLIKCLEILFTFLSSSSGSSLMSITTNYNNHSNESVINKSTNTSNIHQQDNCSVIINNSQYNDPESMALAITKSLIPFEQKNIEEICKKTCTILNEQNIQPIIQPDCDFLFKYLKEGSLISNKDIQDIWAHLLAHEYKNPNGISKRTLDIVKNMNSSEANLFTNVAKASFASGEIYQEYCNKMNILDFTTLKDIGLVKNERLSNSINLEPNQENTFAENDLLFVIKNEDSQNSQKVEWGCYFLTSEGQELKKALGYNINDNMVIEHCKNVKAKYKSNKLLSFSLYKIIRFNQNNTVNIDNIDLLKE